MKIYQKKIYFQQINTTIGWRCLYQFASKRGNDKMHKYTIKSHKASKIWLSVT